MRLIRKLKEKYRSWKARINIFRDDFVLKVTTPAEEYYGDEGIIKDSNDEWAIREGTYYYIAERLDDEYFWCKYQLRKVVDLCWFRVDMIPIIDKHKRPDKTGTSILFKNLLNKLDYDIIKAVVYKHYN